MEQLEVTVRCVGASGYGLVDATHRCFGVSTEEDGGLVLMDADSVVTWTCTAEEWVELHVRKVNA